MHFRYLSIILIFIIIVNIGYNSPINKNRIILCSLQTTITSHKIEDSPCIGDNTRNTLDKIMFIYYCKIKFVITN